MTKLSNGAAALLWMSGALVSFMAMAVGIRELSADLSTFQILFFRSLVGVGVACSLLTVSGWRQIRTRKLATHAARNIAHFCGQFGWAFAIAIIPMAEVFAIEFTTPLWTAVLAALFLGERLTRARVAAIFLGFMGVLVVLRPGVEIIDMAALAVLASALCYAVSHALTKGMSTTETPLSIIFYMAVIQLPLGLVPSLYNWVWPSGAAWGWIVVVGVAALNAHYCIVRAFQRADATVVVPLDFLRLPLIALVGFVFYQEPLDMWVLAGAALIFAGTWFNVRSVTSKQTAGTAPAAQDDASSNRSASK